MSLKHHVAIKFIAVFLAALALLAAVGSATGVICLVETDLYENSFNEVYQEQMASTRRNFAVNLAHRYASLNLGGLSEIYLDQYYGESWLYNTFEYDKYCYVIRDENGSVVESTLFDDLTDATRYEIVVTDISYRHVVTDPTQLHQSDGETTENTTNVPDDTAPVTDPTVVTDEQTETSPSASEPGSTQEPTSDTTETAASEELTASPGGLASDEEMQDARMASEDAGAQEIHQDAYWNFETDQYEEFLFYYDSLPAYTVELYLFPGALPEDTLWSILRIVWTYRIELFYVLGASLLVFAIVVVYLCCAAGKRPGSHEIQPGGLNRLPLDLYLGGGGLVICLLIAIGAEVAYYLARYAPQVLLPFGVLVGYAGCLIIVGFCFACAAQLKAPGGYWWRHSFVGWCLLKVWRGLKWVARGCRNIGRSIQTMIAMLPLIWQWLLTAALMVVVPTVLFFFILAFRFEDFLEFFFILLFISSIAAGIAVICYGAYCFGILMKGARKMAQGDLGYQIPTKYLFGCFRDFAIQLNALADAAQVAAARQMRSERMKTELITNVSHDIKTPLTSIINYVDLLQKPHTQEEGAMYLEVLSRQSLRLKKLIDDLMDMSKASTGNMTVEATHMDAAEAITQALGEFADKLTMAQLTPVFRPPEKPVFMMADGRLVWRVMSNLLSNAVKYALPGTRLYIDLMELEDKVVISLKNISREELNVSADELLERFVRGDTSRNTEGSGLGLNIAQSLMELQKGQLQLLVDGDLFKVTLVFPSANEL